MNRKLSNFMRGNELFKRIGDCAVSGVVRIRVMRKNVGNF
jgi:hypothetical protein